MIPSKVLIVRMLSNKAATSLGKSSLRRSDISSTGLVNHRRTLFSVLKLLRTYLTDKVPQVYKDTCPEIFITEMCVRAKD